MTPEEIKAEQDKVQIVSVLVVVSALNRILPEHKRLTPKQVEIEYRDSDCNAAQTARRVLGNALDWFAYGN